MIVCQHSPTPWRNFSNVQLTRRIQIMRINQLLTPPAANRRNRSWRANTSTYLVLAHILRLIL